MGRVREWVAGRVVTAYHFGLQVLLLGLILLFFLQEVLSSIRRCVWRRKSDRNRVVIVGGGFSGSQVARQLEEEFDVTIIDTKRFFEFTPSALRALVEPHHSKVIQRAHLHYLRRANFVHDHVVSLNQSAAVTSANGSIPYDFLVVCTGASYATLPGRASNDCLLLSARVHNLASHFNSVSRARSVLIIGAGTVGVELAAEIIERFPSKDITLVGPLLARSTSKSARYASEWLTTRNVNLMPGDKVLRNEGRVFYLSSGRTVEADVAFVCTGNVPNSGFMQKSPVFAPSLTPTGFARANQHLLLDGFNNVFVAGDMTYIPGEEEKLCQDALECASVISDNITRLSRSPSAKLATYEPCKRPMIVSLGKYDGMFTYRGWTVCGFICALMKDFVEWKEMVHYQGSFWPGAPRYTPAMHLHAV